MLFPLTCSAGTDCGGTRLAPPQVPSEGAPLLLVLKNRQGRGSYSEPRGRSLLSRRSCPGSQRDPLLDSYWILPGELLGKAWAILGSCWAGSCCADLGQLQGSSYAVPRQVLGSSWAAPLEGLLLLGKSWAAPGQLLSNSWAAPEQFLERSLARASHF